MCQSWRRTICDGPVLDYAMLRAGSWSRSNSFWGTSQFKPPNGTLGASSEFGQPSMIALGSSRTLDVAEPLVEGLPTTGQRPGPLRPQSRLETEGGKKCRVGNSLVFYESQLTVGLCGIKRGGRMPLDRCVARDALRNRP